MSFIENFTRFYEKINPEGAADFRQKLAEMHTRTEDTILVNRIRSDLEITSMAREAKLPESAVEMLYLNSLRLVLKDLAKHPRLSVVTKLDLGDGTSVDGQGIRSEINQIADMPLSSLTLEQVADLANGKFPNLNK